MAKPTPELPTKEQLLEYIRSSSAAFSKRELAKAFNISGDLRVPFKQLLRELLASGEVAKTPRNNLKTQKADIKPVMVMTVQSIEEKHIILKPLEDIEFPKVTLSSGNFEIGQKLLVRLKRVNDHHYLAMLIKAIPAMNRKVMAIFEGHYATFTDKNKQIKVTLEPSDITPELKDMILIELISRDHGVILKVFDNSDHADHFSFMTILSKEIPHEFPEAALKLAKEAKPVSLGKREDLRKIPLVTIDGEDAKDFDDAVYAQKDDHPGNPEGWYVLVAIADVAHYVTPGDPLDRSAYERGNSVYFPGTVVPMLPEELSNELCSLKPNVERASLVVHMWIDGKGRLINYRFSRALIKSYARLTYNEVEKALGKKEHPLEHIITPLHHAFKVLQRAREYRGALGIESRENKIIFDVNGGAIDILPKQQLVSHKIIEEFMVLANVAAATFLEEKDLPCMYRIHPKPDPVKAQNLRDFLIPLQVLTPQTSLVKPSHFNDLLKKVKDSPFAQLVNDMVLRSQSQAVYSPKNIGHFGLGLEKYAHFTSPIRRYSDLIVHRSILTALGEDDGQSNDLMGNSGLKKLEDIGTHISSTERRAADAEREVMSKYIAQVMENHTGEVFEARISSVQSFGFFVSISPYGVDGLVHIRTLDPRDYFIHDPKRHLLRGERSKKTYALGDQVLVVLLQADTLTGKLTFGLHQEIEVVPFSPPTVKKKKKLKKERFQSR